MMASASPELLARWDEGLQGFASVFPLGDLAMLEEQMARIRPQCLLVDVRLPGLNGGAGIASLRRRNPATKIVAMSVDVSDDAELALFKSGVRGVAEIAIDTQVLKRIVVAVQQGELWIRRRVTMRLLDELSVNAGGEIPHHRVTDARLAVLTNREREIAKLIGNGDTNKQIARQLCITERTVKAHLTEIFRKLGIGDRLRLALRVTARPEMDAR